MRKKLVLIAAFIAILAFIISGCKPAASPTKPVVTQTGPTVYTAGYYETDDTGPYYNPCYWAGTTMTNLYADGYDGAAFGITISAGTVYTAGYDEIGGAIDSPCYWTGTTRHILPFGPGYEGYANALTIANNEIYIAGNYENTESPQQMTACYWANGVEQDLTEEYDACAYGITVSGGTVYTAGYYQVSSTAQHIACHWNGTTKIDLGSGSDAQAYGLALVNGVVYAVGYYNNGTNDVPCCWEGLLTRVDLPLNSSTYSGVATSIFIYYGNIFIGGSYNNGMNDVPCYWTLAYTGTTETDMPGYGLNTAGDSWAIFVNNNTVYLGGTNGSDPFYGPCYWVNGAETDLPYGQYDGEVYAIGVQ